MELLGILAVQLYQRLRWIYSSVTRYQCSEDNIKEEQRPRILVLFRDIHLGCKPSDHLDHLYLSQ